MSHSGFSPPFEFEHPEAHPSFIPWEEKRICLKLTHRPSFTPYCTWVLYKSIPKKNSPSPLNTYNLRRVLWDHANDYLTPESPTTYASQSPIPTETVEDLLTQLTTISFPFFSPISTIGINGETFSIQLWTSTFERRPKEISWWSQNPKEWEAITQWYQHAVHIFDAFLPQHNQPATNLPHPIYKKTPLPML